MLVRDVLKILGTTSKISGYKTTGIFELKIIKIIFHQCFRISEIPENTFDDLTTLEWLKLNNNRLKSIPYELIEPVLDMIKHIDIYSECQLHLYSVFVEFPL